MAFPSSVGVLDIESWDRFVKSVGFRLNMIYPTDKFYPGKFDMYTAHLDDKESTVVTEKAVQTGTPLRPMWNDKLYPNKDISTMFVRDYMVPYISLPTTDLFANFNTYANTDCGGFEKNALECMEYYGLKQGKTICADYYLDLVECRSRDIQVRRVHVASIIHSSTEFILSPQKARIMALRYAREKKKHAGAERPYEPPPKAGYYFEPCFTYGKTTQWTDGGVI